MISRKEYQAKRAKKHPKYAKRLLERAKQTKDILFSGKVARVDFDARMDICNECEHLGRFKRCLKCGCFMNKKARFNGASCPVGKWDQIKEKGDKNGTKKND